MMPYLRLLRPYQWVKNLFVLMPVFFARTFWDPDVLGSAILAMLSFVLISSSVYVLNDLVDRRQDRLHPDKKHRPIASGEISVSQAMIIWVALLVLGLSLGFHISGEFVVVVLGYVTMTMAYSLFLKQVIFLDVILIALGFVFRVLGGGVATGVEVTDWMIVLVFLFTLYLAISKRRQEIKNLERKAESTRFVLTKYTIELIDQVSTIIVPIAITSYIFYTFSERENNPFFILTIPIILYSFFRHLYLMKSSSFGESFKDYFREWMLILAGIVWVILVMMGLMV